MSTLSVATCSHIPAWPGSTLISHGAAPAYLQCLIVISVWCGFQHDRIATCLALKSEVRTHTRPGVSPMWHACAGYPWLCSWSTLSFKLQALLRWHFPFGRSNPFGKSKFYKVSPLKTPSHVLISSYFRLAMWMFYLLSLMTWPSPAPEQAIWMQERRYRCPNARSSAILRLGAMCPDPSYNILPCYLLANCRQ